MVIRVPSNRTVGFLLGEHTMNCPKTSTALVFFAALISTSWPAQASDPLIYLDQGWTEQTRQAFYSQPQGSRLVPESWFRALERADGKGMFADDANLTRYGFLADEAGSPGHLPIGFAIDPLETPKVGRFVGLTCAACHTANVSFEGKVVRIDGAPAQLDFDTFFADFVTAVNRTLLDEATFKRFASRVLKAPDPSSIGQLHDQLVAYQTALAGEATIRTPAVASGFGRADALGQIINQLSVAFQSEPRNLRPLNAPTRYPQLWLTPELEFVQWNPIAASPLGRNSGEVLGVFGSANLTGDGGEAYESTLLIDEVSQMESWVQQLKPPRWDPALFGEIDLNLAKEGQVLYKRACQSCHNLPPYDRTDPGENLFGKTFIKIGRVDFREVGTDPSYVTALVTRSVFTNKMTAGDFGGRSLVSAPEFFSGTVGKIVTHALNKLNLSETEKAAINGFRLRPPSSPGGSPQPYVPPSLADLKASPLSGIWASGPYLHNGSVPTIYELLSPVAERRAVFWTGGPELDVKRLGYVSDDAPGRFRFDTNLPGNHNIGHVYPPEGLAPDERSAIIEFLKTLS